MKYLVSLLLGLLTGAAIAAIGIVFNPIAKTPGLSPLAVSDQSLMQLNYSAVSSASIAYTNNGESATKPHPQRILQLWEAPIRHSDVLMTRLTKANGEFAGLGIKFMSDSESTRLIEGKALIDSNWYVVLPGQGTFFIEQSENYWGFLKEVVLPAHWSSADSWKGIWNGNVTAGPGALGTGRVVGGHGIFSGVDSEVVESISAKAYSSRLGPVAVQGSLLLDMTIPAEITANRQRAQ